MLLANNYTRKAAIHAIMESCTASAGCKLTCNDSASNCTPCSDEPTVTRSYVVVAGSHRVLAIQPQLLCILEGLQHQQGVSELCDSTGTHQGAAILAGLSAMQCETGQRLCCPPE